jgi:hypothetical protein
MEINARFWGSLQLSIDAGVDFPYLLYLQSQGKSITPVKNYNYSRIRWLLGDIDNLFITLKTSTSDYKIPNNYPGIISAIINFFREFGMGSRLEVLRTDDLKPFLLELKNYILTIIKH